MSEWCAPPSLAGKGEVDDKDELLDVLLVGGRCIDPETGLDEIRHVGVAGGSIVCLLDAAAERLPAARSVVDCSGLVVAPGFIDLHSHGAAHAPTARLQALLDHEKSRRTCPPSSLTAKKWTSNRPF